jgi:flagellar biosynthesis protein FlhG
MVSHPVQVVAVTGGKGGVGKSNTAVNLSVALSQLGRRVVLLDADMGLANVDLLLGITAKHSLSEVLHGELTLMDIMVTGPGGIHIIPASSGIQSMVSLSSQEHAGLVQAFSSLAHQLDILVIDTAAGISPMVTTFVQAAQEVLLVVTNEPTSITDAYALIKILHQTYKLTRFRILASMVHGFHEGQQLCQKLRTVTERFLEVSITYEGAFPLDEHVKRAVARQRPFVEVFPKSPAALAMKALAKRVDQWPIRQSPRGHLEFFVEHLCRPLEAEYL